MKLTIAQIDKVLWKGDATSVTVPGADGVMTILAHHMPLIATLKEGIVVVKENTDGETKEFPITKGFVEVGKEETVILV